MSAIAARTPVRLGYADVWNLDGCMIGWRLLDRGDARVVLVIPAGFARMLKQGRQAAVQTLLDGSFANTAIVALNYIDAITDAYTRRLEEGVLAGRLGGAVLRLAPADRVESRVRYNPELRSENFVVPGLFAVILMAASPTT